MSICINNDLIWISVPKCASMSVEKAIMSQNDVNYVHINEINPHLSGLKERHLHINVDTLKEYFGELETVRIKRDWLDRWLSSFEYIWVSIKRNGLTPKYNYHEIDNEFIYKTFTKDFVNKLYLIDDNYDNLKSLYTLFINETIDDLNDANIVYTGLRTLCSQNFWTNNEKVTYEFDMENISEFERFISNRYNIDFKIGHINKGEKMTNKIIIDDELRNFIWTNFEDSFVRKNKLI